MSWLSGYSYRKLIPITGSGAADETLRPNAVGDETSIPFQYPDSDAHWDKVDEEEADEADTYVGSSTYPTVFRDLYKLPAHSVGSGTINSITIYFRIRGTDNSYQGWGAPCQKSGATITNGSLQSQGTSWDTKSQTYTVNPATGVAYTWDEIDALQIGVVLKIRLSGQSMHCTQVYVEVNYSGAGTDYQVPLTVYSGKWISPTSFDDPDSAWGDETLIYDGNIATFGATLTYDHYLELILDSAIDTDTIRIYGKLFDPAPAGGDHDLEVDIDLFYDADWHNIFSGTIAKNTWVEKTNPAGVKSVTKARIKSNNESYRTFIYEFEFQPEDSAGVVYLWDYCTDFPNDIRFTDDDGNTELDHWLVDNTADPCKFWIKVDDDLDDNQDIYIYYGKSGASSDSNGANTFPDFYQDFEDQNDGDAPTGWAAPAHGTIEVDDAQSHNGTKSMLVTGSVAGTLTSKRTLGSGLTNKAIMYWIRQEYSGDNLGMYVYDGATQIMVVGLTQNNKVQYWDTAWRDVVAYSPDTWYKLEYLNIDFTNNQYDIAVNDVVEKVNAAFRNAGTNIDDIEAVSWSGAPCTAWIDALVVRKQIDPEPVVGTAGEEEEEAPAGIPTLWNYYFRRRIVC